MMDKITGTNLLAVDQAVSNKPGKTGEDVQDERFAQELAGAQAMASQIPQSVVTQPELPVARDFGSMEGANPQAPVAVDASRIGPRANALGTMERPGTGAERSPLTLASAVSMNTAAAIAGPKPWGKEWVFEGASRNPDIQPLFESAPKAADLMEVRSGCVAAGALTELQDLVAGMAKAVGAESAEVLAQAAQRAVGETGMAAAQGQSEALRSKEEGQLASLMGANGALEGVSFEQAEQPLKPVRTNGPVANASLSGSEYLSTVEALKGGQSGEKPGNQSGREESEGQGGALNSNAGLKVIEGGLKSRRSGSEFEELSMNTGIAQAGQQIHAQHRSELSVSPRQEVVGHVVKGAMSQDRLSTESLNGISTGIRTFSAQGGGEMRIRLNPGNLGELQVKVVTQGNQVGLQIQASDERAKKILEESIGSLKTSLAAQNLTLGQVDLSVSQTQTASSGFDGAAGRDAQAQQQQQAQQSFDQNRSGSDRWNGSWSGGEERVAAPSARSALSTASRASVASQASAARAYSHAGRLDVRA